MAREVVLLDEANRDLTELAVYIAGQSGEAVASRYLDRLYEACMALAHFPERGTKRRLSIRSEDHRIRAAGDNRFPRSQDPGGDCHHCVRGTGLRK